MTIDTRQMQEQLLHDSIDAAVGGNLYVNQGKPYCFGGQLLYRLGVPLSKMRSLEGRNIETAFYAALPDPESWPLNLLLDLQYVWDAGSYYYHRRPSTRRQMHKAVREYYHPNKEPASSF